MEALPLPLEIAFARKRRAPGTLLTVTVREIDARAFRRRVWERSRGPIAAVLMFTCAAIWAVRYHEFHVERLTRENEDLRVMLLADREPVTVVITGCGRDQVAASLAITAGRLDQFRYELRRAQ